MNPDAKSPFYTEEHHAFRATVRRFVDKEIEPHVSEWDEAGTFPRELYRKAAEIGILGLGYPEAYGGTAGDRFHKLIAAEEICRAGSGGLSASLYSHTIGLPPVFAVGSEELKRRVGPPVLSGDKIMALAITEPGGGSDVAAVRTTAKRVGDDYLVNGQKMFITSGMRADFYTVAVRTGGEGQGGISLLLIERDRPGFTRTPLKKMGWWASDTAALYFDDVRVPATNMVGGENHGFIAIMLNFNAERVGLATKAYGMARTCFDEALAYARERQAFGRPLIHHQVIRHKLADMAMRIAACKAVVEILSWRLDQGELPVAEICLAKNQCVEAMEFCAKEAVQILGGSG
ncbi:MAG: acyl-CoA dehydrogenase, partial [Alphaproteobacteria bacterium]|nr:acyl-CoA dehydrogenase [Alphaproteobacteria bacterium]